MNRLLDYSSNYRSYVYGGWWPSFNRLLLSLWNDRSPKSFSALFEVFLNDRRSLLHNQFDDIRRHIVCRSNENVISDLTVYRAVSRIECDVVRAT